MLIIANANGDIMAVSPSSVHQGSIDANKIILLAPFAKSATVSVLVTLPNRLSLYPQLAENTDPSPYNMAALDLDLGLNNPNGVAMNAWVYSLSAPITQYSGNVTLQFLVTLPDGTSPTTSAVNIPVSRGSAWIAPSVSESDVNTIAAYLAAALTAAINADADAVAAELWATGAYIDNTDDSPTEKPAEPGDPQYQNNAKYYAEQAEFDAKAASSSAGLATTAASEADSAKKAAEAAALIARQSAKNASSDANTTYTYLTAVQEAEERIQDYAEEIGDGAANFRASINNQTYVLTLELLDASGAVMSVATIDLPLESSITNIAYDDASKDIIFTLRNGSTTRVPLDDIVSGLATEAALNAGLAGKVDKLTAALKLYGTDSNGNQTSYSIVGVTGNSTLAIMTQAAVTAALNALETKISSNTQRIAALEAGGGSGGSITSVTIVDGVLTLASDTPAGVYINDDVLFVV